MRRVVSVWFPHWPTDRLRRRRGSQAAAPLVTALHDGRKRVIVAADPAALALGLRPGVAVAQALALVPELEVAEAEPEADGAALRRLALWCHSVTPLAAPCPPDGLWLDVTGCVHDTTGEAALLHRLVTRLERDGLQARAAAAGSPGCAHALARHGAHCIAVSPQAQAEALAALPVAALRISPELEAKLRRLGFERIVQLMRVPPALLARRFGPLPGLRLEQAHGLVQEPIEPVAPEHPLQHRLAFLEPLLTAEALQAVIPWLAGPVCREMEQLGLGARQVDLVFDRVDGHAAAIRIGTARPSRDAAHLSRMLMERLGTIDPGLGVEAMWLAASLTQPLDWEQQGDAATTQDVARLVDRLANRLGTTAVYRTAPAESDVPERMTKPAEAAGFIKELPQEERAPPRPEPEPYMPQQVRGNHLQLVSHAAVSRAAPSPAPRAGTPLHLVGASAATPAAMRGSQGLSHLPARAGAPGRPLLSGVNHPPRTVQHSDRSHLVLLPDSVGGEFTCGRTGLRSPDPLDRDPPLLPWVPKPEPHAEASRLGRAWLNRLEAPSRLLEPPRAVKAMAGLPDGPPAAFTWRRRHIVRRADGPERVMGEWWRTAPEAEAIRDYFIVEDESGQRFWLFRRGNGIDPCTGNLDWFLHGLF